MRKQLLTQEQMTELLEKCYGRAMSGLPGSRPCDELAKDYLEKYNQKEIAAKRLIDVQISKCTTFGFVAGLGGLITLPVAVPANVASVLYTQIRMIGALAVIGGYDLKNDEVQTMVYLCLINSSVSDICKLTGVQITNKITMAMLKKLPGSVLQKINHKVGFKLFTKFGEKGVVNFVKLLPIAGGVVSGGVDFVGTRLIADKAYKAFILNEVD